MKTTEDTAARQGHFLRKPWLRNPPYLRGGVRL